MPNTIPPNDSRAITETIVNEARTHGTVRVHPIGCVSKGQRGEELAEMGDMHAAGARAFSDDGKPVHSSALMRRALEYSRIFDAPIIDHCEDPALSAGGQVHEGEVSTRLGLPGWPAVAEDVMVERDLLLAEYTGGHVHIAHMSSGRAAAFVREAKRRKVRATCEVTPHHLFLTHEAVAQFDTDAKMNPPLRSPEDRGALLKALADGTVDAIATDHAPHHPDEKAVEFCRAPFGIVGLETAVALCLDRLVDAKVIDLPRLVALFTVGPARVLRLAAGTLAPGAPADVTVLDLKRTARVEPREFRSKSRNTPFAGLKLKGAPVMTIVAGKIVHDAR
jgi:dihydroorotase